MSTAKKIYLSSAIFIISFGLFVFIILILFADIKKKSGEIPLQKQDLSFLQAKIDNLGKFKNIYQEVNPNLDEINNLFIDPEVPVEFIGFLEKTSQDCGISINTSLLSAKKSDKDFWNFLSFRITAASSFSKFLTFLEKVENSHYLIEIQNLNIKRLSEDDLKLKDFEGFSVGDVEVNLSIKVYTK